MCAQVKCFFFLQWGLFLSNITHETFTFEMYPGDPLGMFTAFKHLIICSGVGAAFGRSLRLLRGP